jgi:hypothetical protein
MTEDGCPNTLNFASHVSTAPGHYRQCCSDVPVAAAIARTPSLGRPRPRQVRLRA